VAWQPSSQRGQPSGDAVSAAALTGPLQAALPGRTAATTRARAISRLPLGHAGGWHASTRRVARQRDAVSALPWHTADCCRVRLWAPRPRWTTRRWTPGRRRT